MGISVDNNEALAVRFMDWCIDRCRPNLWFYCPAVFILGFLAAALIFPAQ